MNPAGAPARIEAVHALRAAAALLVVYSHLVGGVLDNLRQSWPPHDLVRAMMTALGLSQNLGALGVMIFFIISGYVIAHVAGRDGRAGFLVKRALRIYPPLIAAIAVTVLVYRGQAWATGREDYFSPVPLADAVFGMLAIDRLIGVPRAILPVGWTLTVEVVFYLHAALLLPLLRARPTAFAIGLCTWSLLVASLAMVRPELTQTIASFQFLPLFAIGIAFHEAARGALGPLRQWGPIALAFAAFVGCLALGRNPDLGPPVAYPLQALYAIIIFAVATRWIGHAPRWVGFFGDISYSMYLVHHPMGLFAYGWVYGWFGLTASIAAAFAVTVLLAWVSFRWIEAPAQAYARALTSPRQEAR